MVVKRNKLKKLRGTKKEEEANNHKNDYKHIF
jgi:hypothetical protein